MDSLIDLAGGPDSTMGGLLGAFQNMPSILAGSPPPVDPSTAQMLPPGALQQQQGNYQQNFWNSMGHNLSQGSGLFGALGASGQFANNAFNNGLSRSIQQAQALRAMRQQNQSDAAFQNLMQDPTLDPQTKQMLQLGGPQAAQQFLERQALAKEQEQMRKDLQQPHIVGNGGVTERYIQRVMPDGTTQNIPNPNFNPASLKQGVGTTMNAQALIQQYQPVIQNLTSQHMLLGQAAFSRMTPDERNAVLAYEQSKGLSGFDMAGAKAELTGLYAGMKAAGTREANVQMVNQELQPMRDVIIKNLDGVTRTDFTPLNSAIAAGASRFGSTAETNYAASLNSFVNSYARLMGGATGVTSDQARNDAYELLNKAQTKEQVIGVLHQLADNETAAIQKGTDNAVYMMANMTKYPKLMKIAGKLGYSFDDLASGANEPLTVATGQQQQEAPPAAGPQAAAPPPAAGPNRRSNYNPQTGLLQ